MARRQFAALTLLSPAFSAELPSSQTFSDVPPGHWAWEWIERLHAAGLTAGYPDGTFRPDNPVTRAEMAVFLKKGIHGAAYLPPAPSGGHPFGDISGHWAEPWIEQLYKEGLTSGHPDGTFRPEGRVTRAEIAVFLLKAKFGSSYSPPAPQGGAFVDIAGHWAEAWIEQLEAEGISAGYPDGTYRPENEVTRAEMAVFLVVTFNLDALPTPTLTPSATPTATPSKTPSPPATPSPSPTASPTLGAPSLLAPSEGSFWAKVTFDWTDVSGAVGYWLELSSSATFNSLAYQRFVGPSELTYKSGLDGTYYWRVKATDTERPFSLLLVDDDDNGPDVRSHYTNALDSLGVTYDLWNTSNSDIEPDAVTLADYSAIAWFTGDEFGGAAGPGAAGEAALASYLDTGGCLFISSQDYLYDRGQTAFMTGYLGVGSFSHDLGQATVTGAGSVFAGLGLYALVFPFDNYSDRISPSAGAELAFSGDQGDAAINREGTGYRTTFWGFPFEALPTVSARNEAMSAFLSWCGGFGAMNGAAGDGPYSETRSIQLVGYFDDADGDSLPNGWELHGYDPDENGVVDIDLPALGAGYRRMDVFVEMDYMFRASALNGLGPNQAVLDEIVQVFADALISNPYGSDGIVIHLDLDDQVPYADDLNPVTTQFNALRDTYFDAVRRPIYHYMIWANKYSGGTSSGLSFGIPAVDFIVTLGAWNGGNGGTDYQKIGTFIHELGHNLGLTHGGNDQVNYKPNYLGVMNYLFQTGGVYRDGSWYNFDYQRFPLPALNEGTLDETVGLNGGSAVTGYGTRHGCPDGTWRDILPADGPIDWNCDGAPVDSPTAVDINGDLSLTLLGSQDNWANLVLDGGGVIGSALPPEFLKLVATVSITELPIDELTFEQQLLIDQWFEEPTLEESASDSLKSVSISPS